MKLFELNAGLEQGRKVNDGPNLGGLCRREVKKTV